MRVTLPLLLVSSLAAQGVQVSLQTQTPVGVLATTPAGTKYVGTPANTPITTSPGNMYNFVNIDTGTYLSAVTLAYPQPAGNSVAILERGYARAAVNEIAGTTASAQAQGAVQGPHSFLMTITAPQGTKGALSVSWHSKAVSGASIAGAIDIGNDNSVEYTGAANVAERKTFPYTFGTQPLVVKITTDGKVPGQGNNIFNDYFADCFVGFIEDKDSKCTFTNYGQSCGPTSSGSVSTQNGQHKFTLNMANGYPNAFAVSMVGTSPLNVSIGNNCYLLTTIDVARPLVSDANGNSTDTWNAPSTLVGRVYFQFLSLTIVGGNLVLQSSDGTRIDCVR